MTVRLLTPKTAYTIDYPTATAFSESQAEILWLPDEIEMDKDLHDLKTNMTDAELHGVSTVLKLFTLYETEVGNNYWLGRIKRLFKRPDIERMATTFGYVELGIHAPFYNKINEALGLNTDEFYNSYVDNPALKARMDWINDIVMLDNSPINLLKSIGAFAIIEGAVLYSSFAFLKHFQSEGKNKLTNLIAGINFSVKDENCLIAGTEVLTQDGWKKIEDISLSDSVCSYDINTGESSFNTPKQLFNTKASTSYIIEGSNSHSHTTAEHRNITTDGVVLSKDLLDNSEIILNGLYEGDDILTDEDTLSIELIVNEKLDVSWIYNKIPYVSSIWAERAVNYYLSLINE